MGKYRLEIGTQVGRPTPNGGWRWIMEIVNIKNSNCSFMYFDFDYKEVEHFNKLYRLYEIENHLSRGWKIVDNRVDFDMIRLLYE